MPTLPQLLHFKTTHGSINVAERIGRRYKAFGALLLEDAAGSYIAAIEMESHHNVYDINFIILLRWLQGMGRLPVTWDTLIEVLRVAGLSTLAQDLQNNL